MIFASLSLLSGLFLLSNAAPVSPPSPRAGVVHQVKVSNNAGELAYDPPFVVSQPSGLYISIVLTRLSFRLPINTIPSCSRSNLRTTL